VLLSAKPSIARVGQVALGLLWLLDGVLQFQPYMFGKRFVTGVILPAASGQPGIIRGPIVWMAGVIEPRVALFNAGAATLQILIGLGLLYRRTVRFSLLVSFVWASAIWFAGEGLGMVFTGNASPLTGAPGAALLYLPAGVLCWPGQGGVGDARREAAVRVGWSAMWQGCAVLWLLPANAGPGALGLAAVSAAIGISALYRWHTKFFLALAIAVSACYWTVGQDFGGVFTGQATDPGTAPVVVLVASLLLAREGARSPGQRRVGARARSAPAPQPGR
jgi:hypothetical protein